MSGFISEARALARRGLAARQAESFNQAKTYLQKAARILREYGPDEDLSVTLRELAEVERAIGNVDEACRLYGEAIRLQRALPGRTRLAHTLRRLGNIHRDAGKLDEAAPLYLEALSLYKADENAKPLDLAETLRDYAILLEAMGDRLQARLCWAEAETGYIRAGEREGAREAARRIAASAS